VLDIGGGGGEAPLVEAGALTERGATTRPRLLEAECAKGACWRLARTLGPKLAAACIATQRPMACYRLQFTEYTPTFSSQALGSSGGKLARSGQAFVCFVDAR
jgi:hypothetical protein